jgi:hypothetical protein
MQSGVIDSFGSCCDLPCVSLSSLLLLSTTLHFSSSPTHTPTHPYVPLPALYGPALTFPTFSSLAGTTSSSHFSSTSRSPPTRTLTPSTAPLRSYQLRSPPCSSSPALLASLPPVDPHQFSTIMSGLSSPSAWLTTSAASSQINFYSCVTLSSSVPSKGD